MNLSDSPTDACEVMENAVTNERKSVEAQPANKKIMNKKIRLGQFLTSYQIADFMVGLSTKKNSAEIFEPCAGRGVFLDALLKNGYQNIKAVEYDKEFYDEIKERFQNITIKNSDFLQTSRDEKFDLIIGNPPYVQWNNIEPTIRKKLDDDNFWARYSNGEWDLLYAFIVWSIEKLKDDGELIFIVPYNWFNSTFGESLREYLVKYGYFDIIIHFGELKLFADCFPNNIIFKYVKGQHVGRKITVCDYNEKKADITDLFNQIRGYIKEKRRPSETQLRCFEMDNFTDSKMWFLGTPDDFRYIRKVESNARSKLSDHCDVCVGMVSGYDDAYTVYENELKNFSENERKLIFRFIKAKDCERYSMKNTSYYIFVDDVSTEAELKEYPKIYQKLILHKNALTSRYNSDKEKWWHWATVRNYEAFKRNLNRGKIFVPGMDRAERSRYSYTNGTYYGSGDVLMIAPKNGMRESLYYILAWLNSNVINKWYQIKGSKKGQRTQYTQAYVSKIPLRLIDWNNPVEVETHNKLVDICTDLVKNGVNPEKEAELDALIEKLVK